MKVPINSSKNNPRRSELSRKLLIQYSLSILGFIAGIVALVFLAQVFFGSFIWQPDDKLYMFLHFIKDHILLFAGLIFLVGWVFITYRFISKPLRYLDNVVEAAEKLTAPTSEPFIMPNDMHYVENELNRAREKALENARAAKDAEQRKNDLVMYLAHDLKTPLSSVIGYLTLLNEEKQISDELKDKYLSVSLKKAQRLEDLINEFFEITRFNRANLTLEYSKINLTLMLQQIIFEFKPMFDSKRLNCELKAASGIMISCDADKIQRVFDNLLRNAANYSFEDTAITVTADTIEDKVRIKVTNEGNTIPKENLDLVFEQFFRLDTARSSSSGGAGLGLAIAKEIVELHHGTITADSKDQMTCFEVIIPIVGKL